jgi:hypothetical protein
VIVRSQNEADATEPRGLLAALRPALTAFSGFWQNLYDISNLNLPEPQRFIVYVSHGLVTRAHLAPWMVTGTM